MTKTLILILGSIVAVGVGALVVWSILSDASMLVGVGGYWMLLLFLVVPACVAIYTWHEDIRRWWQDRRFRRQA